MHELPPLEQHSLRLDNGVQATLLHDPQACRLALAAGVDAGSLHEPEAWPGLAHFLEHCLFLGSAGFAEVGAFAGYVHGCGGRYNARTLGLHSQYYLEMPARELAPALERFCDLLARPLLLPERLLAEREVLHAEYLARCQDGDSQLLGALAGLFDPAHPLAHFHAGARDSLDPQSAAFLAELRAWHARYYRGGNLRLLVCGPQSLGELEAQVRAVAGALPGGARVPVPAWPSPWPAGQGCRRMELEQPARRCMSLWWALEHVAARDEPALERLRQALQRSDAGSLPGVLLARGLARSARLELHPADAGQALLALHLELLADGCGREEEIAALCRDWLAWLRDAPERIGDPALIESLRIGQAWDEYEQAPLERAALWLERWQRQGGSLPALWPAPAANAVLGDWLNPLAQPPLVLQCCRNVLAQGECTPRFPVRYRLLPQAGLPLVQEAWQPAAVNPFQAPALPSAAGDWPVEWRSTGAELLRPGHAALLLAWQAAESGVEAQLAAELAELALAERWATLAGEARPFGFDCRVTSRAQHLHLCLSGPPAALPLVLECLLAALREGDAARWREAWRRRRDAQGQQILLRRLLAHPAARTRQPVDEDALARRLEALDEAGLSARVAECLTAADLCGWRMGEVPSAVLPLLRGLGRPAAVPAPRQAMSGEHELHLGIAGSEQAVLLRLLAPPGEPRREAAWRLLAILWPGAFHQALRVEQGLGYALFCRFVDAEEGAELQFGVQSPHVPAARLQQTIREFLVVQRQHLAGLDAGRLAAVRRAAREALDEGSRPARLQRAAMAWLGGRADDWSQRLCAELESLQVGDLLAALAGADIGRQWLLSRREDRPVRHSGRPAAARRDEFANGPGKGSGGFLDNTANH
ncbi:pyrroloquinoline quinone biosynthesis protein PqqF [Azotobacter chroococcum subsp. isscasi]|uniref:insulinase family protein n=1 Tax=Azotobacter chroococcum TaxID=353 RepID=UPI0010397931|nr:insulinase family protein [Azotobacter chroococcum]TBW06498.1 pyrroloquinoline quinone biosynthesis protein PqqF [Azotobacter chroococcum subsp. isscasi]